MHTQTFRIFFCIAITTSLFISTPSQAQHSLEPHRQAFLKKINEYRASIGLPALQRWKDGENCADYEAKRDSEENKPHASMGSCGEIAQNSCPHYPSIASGYLDIAYRQGGHPSCLHSMWKEGPPPLKPCEGSCFKKHGHYLNMTNKEYTKVATGIYKKANEDVWININFK